MRFFQDEPPGLREFKSRVWGELSPNWKPAESLDMVNSLRDWWLKNLSINGDNDLKKLTNYVIDFVKEIADESPDFLPLDYTYRFNDFMRNILCKQELLHEPYYRHSV